MELIRFVIFTEKGLNRRKTNLTN